MFIGATNHPQMGVLWHYFNRIISIVTLSKRPRGSIFGAADQDIYETAEALNRRWRLGQEMAQISRETDERAACVSDILGFYRAHPRCAL